MHAGLDRLSYPDKNEKNDTLCRRRCRTARRSGRRARDDAGVERVELTVEDGAAEEAGSRERR